MKTKRAITGLSLLFAGLLGITQVAVGQSSSSSSLPSNTNAFGKGTNVINLGVGIGGDYTYFGSGYSSTPNIVLSYENGTFGNVGPGTISLGGLLSYKGISYDYTEPYSGYTYNQNWNYYIIGFRSAYHWNFTSNDHFDPYVGLMLAYYDISYKYTTNDPYYNQAYDPYYASYSNTYSSYVAFSLYLGARYYFSNSVGVWAELGYGYSTLSLGVSFKF